jgi:hypothetical protein
MRVRKILITISPGANRSIAVNACVTRHVAGNIFTPAERNWNPDRAAQWRGRNIGYLSRSNEKLLMGLFLFVPARSRLHFRGLGNWIILDCGPAIQTISAGIRPDLFIRIKVKNVLAAACQRI